MRLGRRNLMLIAVVVIIGLVLTGGIPLLLTVTATTAGVGYEFRDVTGGSDANGGGDLLNAPAYVTAWTSDGESELISIQGHYANSAGYDFTPDFDRYWYLVTFTVDNQNILINGVAGTTYKSVTYENTFLTSVSFTWVPAESLNLQITGPCVGKVRVEFWGHIHDLNPLSSDDGLLAVDEAYLRSGIGKVQCTDDVVEEGSYAKIYVETGYSHTSIEGSSEIGGWTLQISNYQTGVVVFKKTISDNYAGTVSWLVPEGTYSPTSDNKFYALLRNELIDQDDDDIFIVGVGMIDDIPDKPTFKIIDGDAPFSAGESITVKVSADKNTYEIDGFWVSVSYETSAGTTTEYVIRSKWFDATQTTTGGYCEVTFTFPSSGYVRMEASAVDTMNLNSGNSEITWTIYGEEGGTVGGIDLGEFDYIGLVIVAFLIVAAFVVFTKVPLPEYIKWIVVLAILAIAAYFMLGVIQSAGG